MRKSLAGWCVLIAASGFGCASTGARFTPTRPDPFSRMETLSRILVLEDSRSLGAGAIQGFLENDDPSIRRRAAIAAGRIGDPLAGPSLTRRLKDPVKEVAQSAAFALGLIGSKDSMTALLEALKGSDPELRGRAAEALLSLIHI